MYIYMLALGEFSRAGFELNRDGLRLLLPSRAFDFRFPSVHCSLPHGSRPSLTFLSHRNTQQQQQHRRRQTHNNEVEWKLTS